MPEIRNIVFLGTSYAGLGAAHYFLKHIHPTLPKDEKVTYRVVLVDPSTKFYLRHASPRALASEALMPNKHIFLPTENGFKQYGDTVTFVQGKAVSWDTESRGVTIRKANGKEEVLLYHALILATGTKTPSPLYSLQGTPHTDIEAALAEIRGNLATAKHIVIAGGGPAGVESAGELGELLNGRAGWFASRPSHPQAQITLYTNSDKLLPVLRPSIGKQAEVFLKQVGVDVQYNTKISSSQPLSNGQTSVMLHNGEEVVTDIYIPAMGLSPMTEYVPKHLLDPQGYVKTNDQTLRVNAAGPRVYAVGDVGTYSRNSIIDIMDSIPVLETNLKRDLLAAHVDYNAKPSGPDRLFKAGPAETQIVPVGRSKGVGALFGWRLPSWFVWLLKSRNFMVTEAGVHDRLMGNDWAKEKAWNGK
ncbi:Oxidoreductase phnG [Fulvia fulva]|uniref:Oxidoreductase phnG n=1 Tax=Passalora fulva TaxID=5499 RepID=A0A9Q8P3Y2_PASFU|nr:Oxidoreductase phnG [Fulvia fulva]KAK4634059.1 Oxidoreductase phnG [Fulvia fulva]KAK4637609.1 Oxidoreductase phnG [Fulvia fulva]UJO12241.1 Oxidoreductase phnG [Fulvia fulva]WPV09586.1 Oxidoreductase phnG [Fulvia fulva]WPV25061.1 Oxidoreductase phnG [Fulvia fulva]